MGPICPRFGLCLTKILRWMLCCILVCPFKLREVVWAARYEMARTVEDVLARRTRALFLDARAAIEAAPAVAGLLARELQRCDAWKEESLSNFVQDREGLSLRRMKLAVRRQGCAPGGISRVRECGTTSSRTGREPRTSPSASTKSASRDPFRGRHSIEGVSSSSTARVKVCRPAITASRKFM